MYDLDMVLRVRRMVSEMHMSVTEVGKATGISRTTIYDFLAKKDFNIRQAKGGKGKTVVDIQEIMGSSGQEPGSGIPEAEDVLVPASSSASGEDEGDGVAQDEELSETMLSKGKSRPSKLDPYKPFIISCLLNDKKENRKQRYTNKMILSEIRDQGYDGGHTIFDSYIRELRDELKVEKKKKNKDGYLPLAHFPGESQADFGKARFEEDGLSYNGSFFVLSFPYSNAGYLQLHFGENLECVLESMKAIFEYLGGVPREIWFDNASSIVTEILDGGGLMEPDMKLTCSQQKGLHLAVSSDRNLQISGVAGSGRERQVGPGQYDHQDMTGDGQKRPPVCSYRGGCHEP